MERQFEPVGTTDGNDQNNENQASPAVTATSNPAQVVRATAGTPSGNAVAWLASQIPEFGGAEEDNIQLWTQRVDRVARVHSATDAVTLLAASSKLIKSAKRWYEIVK